MVAKVQSRELRTILCLIQSAPLEMLGEIRKFINWGREGVRGGIKQSFNLIKINNYYILNIEYYLLI